MNDFHIPSFTIEKGQIVVIYIPDGCLFYLTQKQLTKILTGEVINDHTVLNSQFQCVGHFMESNSKRIFRPMTIGRFHKKYANKDNPIYQKVYEVTWVTPQIKVNTLAGSLRRKFLLYSTLSWTNNIIFDLVGVDRSGRLEIFNFVKTITATGGSAILIDCSDEFKNDCTTFLKVEFRGDKFYGATSK
jgi:ABC-type sugar transport system ATPase subunit